MKYKHNHRTEKSSCFSNEFCHAPQLAGTLKTGLYTLISKCSEGNLFPFEEHCWFKSYTPSNTLNG